MATRNSQPEDIDLERDQFEACAHEIIWAFGPQLSPEAESSIARIIRTYFADDHSVLSWQARFSELDNELVGLRERYHAAQADAEKADLVIRAAGDETDAEEDEEAAESFGDSDQYTRAAGITVVKRLLRQKAVKAYRAALAGPAGEKTP